MPSNKLYIVGNGFDLHHCFHTSYDDFRRYVLTRDKELYDRLKRYFWTGNLWSSLESALADFDTELVIDDCMDFYEDYSVENWFDAYHHDYQYEIGDRIYSVTVKLKELLKEWILNIEEPFELEDKMFDLDRSASFLNFNYTDTLERLYKIKNEQINYIHNNAKDFDSELILGHGYDPESINHQNYIQPQENIDPRIREGDKLLDQYFQYTFKPVKVVIQENREYFSSLGNINEIIVLGHSMTDIDFPYFKEIVENISLHDTVWKVSFYDLSDLYVHVQSLNRLGVPDSNIVHGRIDEFESPQLQLF